MMACPKGCSDDASAAAARASSSPLSPVAMASLTIGRPMVSVPVLSSTMCDTDGKAWNASPVRMMIPWSAASPAPRTIESGAAIPTAHG